MSANKQIQRRVKELSWAKRWELSKAKDTTTLTINTRDTRSNGQPPKSQLEPKMNKWLGLTFLASWPFLIVKPEKPH
jgi:hypothetical protein